MGGAGSLAEEKIAPVPSACNRRGQFLWVSPLGSPDWRRAKQRIIDRIASGKPVPYHYYFPVWGFYGVVINCKPCSGDDRPGGLVGGDWIDGKQS